MKVKTLITVQAKDQTTVRWDTPFHAITLLENLILVVEQNPVNDSTVLVTDCEDLLQQRHLNGIEVVAMPPNMHAYNFNYLGVAMGRIAMESAMYITVGADADIVFHVDWRLALLTAHCLERMYHKLLDSPTLPARVVPMQTEDPGLFTRHDVKNRFFPVWHAAGMDRQCMPQMYRPAPACVSYIDRLAQGIPFVQGIDRPGLELLLVDTPYKLELAAYLKSRRERT